MEKKHLEITLKSAVRLGFENKVPLNDIEAQITAWYMKEGEIIGFTEDLNTGKKQGKLILKIESEKAGKDVEAQGLEIGAKITKILIQEKKSFFFNLHKAPLRLAELEVQSIQGSQTSQPEKPDSLRITPLAKAAAKELGADLKEVEKTVPLGTKEITHQHVMAAPATRQIAKKLGVDISKIEGTGKDGMVLERDVEKISRPSKSADFAEFEVIKPTPRRKATARHMAKAWQSPHAAPGIDINPEPLLELRERLKESFQTLHKTKLRIDHFFIAASAYLLSQQEFRILNSYWSDSEGNPEIRLYKQVNVGIAAAISPEKTKSGFSELVVPVIKKAETKTFLEIVKESERLIADATDASPKMEDLSGLTFIVNNTGSPVEWRGMKMPGDEYPDPIFAPETSALLAFGGVRQEGQQKKMRLVLKFDHRIVDGYEPKLFLRALQYLIENPELILTLH